MMSWDRCAIGHPGLMALISGRATVTVTTLVFHEYLFDSILSASSRFRQPLRVFFGEFTNTSFLTGLH
jgi:hypothetical protein